MWLTTSAAAQSALPACPTDGPRHNCHGEISLTNGARYVGEFRDGKRHGRGVDFFASGDRYEGEYRDGIRHGQGTYTHASGDRYVGQYRDGKRHGTGTFSFTNGDRYIGDYRDGVRHGQGTYLHLNGDRYLGEFKDDLRSGLGVFIFGPGSSEGVRYVGQWRDGKPNGQGIEYQPDGTVRRSGLWTNGTLSTASAVEMARFPFAGFAATPGPDIARAERDRLAAEAETERRRRQQLEVQLEAEKKRREEAESRNRGDGTAGRSRTTGTGFAVAPGFLITNQHVVAGCQRLDIVSSDGRRSARVVDSDETVDLALLRVTGLTGQVASLRRAGSIRLGESAYAFGFPLTGLLSEQGNFTNGVVSSLRGMRDSASQIQITTPLQPGNSGGPVVDASGGVIGVVVAKLNAAAVAQATGDIPQNVNFAISIQALTDFLRRHRVAYSTVDRGTSIDTVQLADTLRAFTHRIECVGAPESAAQTPPARREPAAAQSAATDTTVMVWNQAQEPILRLFVSPNNSNSWGTDLLGRAILYTGDSFRVEPPASQGCNFDVRVEYKSGRNEERRGQDFCVLTDLTFSGQSAAQSNTAAPANWVLVSRNVSDTEVYVDPSTIRREGRIRRYWDLTNYPSARSNGALSGRYLMEVDCQEQRARILQSASFTGPMLGGTMISRSGSPGNWDYVAPRTQGAEVMRYVCER